MTDKERSPILIIGAGAMGRLWAGHLSPHVPVRLATRTSPDASIQYTLVDVEGAPELVEVGPSGDTAPECVLVMTKAPDAEAALAAFANALPPAVPIILFQNGMGSQQAIAARFALRPVFAASTTEGAYIDDGRVIHAGRGTTWLGPLTSTATPRLGTVIALLRLSGLDVESDPDIEGRLWQKLAVNAGINPFTAVLDCPNGEILGHPYFEERIGRVCREVAALMQASGRPAEAPGLEAQVRDVARRTAANSSSMRQDVRAGRATEIDMMNGFVVRASAIHGLDAPVNRELTDAVKLLKQD
ncbi:2-dehydropantoate 2-reductase [Marinobacter halodurans]|uniref:2-dehydropantoate 2-reductase n=1 Tax=Marinobacter halodurans TaxID=2528979 RepID=A0ABY1ZKK1_9GAMM|nr:2-dehydropantoate 2-reductase [Marinobacter halodurans]TBW54489.1 2-dehydropantoate 2-reductase [Marinobacter halodurans]